MSTMKLDLISIGEQLPPSFITSFINRLSPKTYLRLRRTCSIINNIAEAAVEKNKLYIVAKHRNLQIDFIEPGHSHASYYLRFEHKRLHRNIEDYSSIFGFHYNEIYLRYYGTWDLSAIEIQELDEFVSWLLSGMRCDTLHLFSLPDPDNLVKFLPTVQPLSLEIWDNENYGSGTGNLSYQPLQPELNQLKEPEIQKIPHLSVQDCKLSYRFNLLDLCQERQTLELCAKESWEDWHPTICQFLQEMYNGADVGSLERLTISTIRPQSWRPYGPDYEELSPQQLGQVPFIVLKPAICQVENHYTKPTALYYCETSSKKLLLSVRPIGWPPLNCIKLDLYITAFDDFSTFIENLADSVYRPFNLSFFGDDLPDAFPIDNSHLYSLLENVHPSQYTPILEDYCTKLNTHMDMGDYLERTMGKQKEDIKINDDDMENVTDIGGTIRDFGLRALAVVSFLLDCCRRIQILKM